MTQAVSDAWTLPWRGLGLSSNLSTSDVPQPYRLLDSAPGLFDFVEYSAPLALDEARAQATLFPEMWSRRSDVPVLFHPVHLNLWGPELEPVSVLKELDAHARAVGSPWVGNDVGWWHSGGQPFPGYLYISPPFNEAGLTDCVVHALHVQSQLSVPLVLENPAVLARRGQWHVLDFMAKLHARTGLPLLLDLGHLFSHHLSSGLPLEAGLDGFPLEHVVEIHIAGGVVSRRGTRAFYVDDHTQPVREELFNLLESLLPRCPSLRAVTFEGDGHPAEMARLSLKRLRRMLPSGTRPPLSLRPPESLAVPPLVGDSRPWELFEAGHGVVPAAGGEDPEGTLADQDFRLAVVAETLDKDWPLSRLLLAGTREQLVSFTASKEYRKLFEGGGRSLSQVFSTWAMRRLREQPDEGASAALSLEMLAPTAFMKAPPPPGPGQVGLMDDVRPASFPVNLSELVFAARTVRRHLTARAWACGSLDLSGLEALGQVARRPGAEPWSFAVRRKAPGHEVVDVSRGLAELLRELGSRPRAVESVPPEVLTEGLKHRLIRLGDTSGVDRPLAQVRPVG